MSKKKKEAKAAPAQQCHGINRADMDLTVKPVDDFYEYASGGWMAAHPLSERPDHSAYGIFTELFEQNEERIRKMFEQLCKTRHKKGSDEQKIVDLYKLVLDVKRRNREGIAPMADDLKYIKSYKKSGNLTRFIANMHINIGKPFFGIGVSVDIKNSDKHMARLSAGDSGLPDRDYYLKTDDESKKIQQAYRDYLVKVFTLAGYSPRIARRMTNTIYDIEYRYAQAKLPREELRNPEKTYNVYSLKRLQRNFPAIDWKEYLEIVGLPTAKRIIVSQPRMMALTCEIMTGMTELQMRDYLTGSLIKVASANLGDDFLELKFDFYGRLLGGQKEMTPLWKRAVGAVNGIMGEAVGKVYVKQFFPPESKARMLNLIQALRDAFASHIADVTWLSDKTKINALVKLNALTLKVGYPDEWDKYDDLIVDPAKSLYENAKVIGKYFYKEAVSKLDKPVDHSLWGMVPQTINAYYSTVDNDICFPAGILQAPFFDPEADDAVNFGAIGAVIGHEITHGFDDQGRKFDRNGNLADWWTDEDIKRFKEVADKLAAQYNAIVVADDLHINAKLTIGENIADLGGVCIALDAFTKTRQYREGKKIDGFTPLQRFFLSFAHVWAINMTDEVMMLQTRNAPHPIGRYRANVTLKNIDAFHEAFGTKPGDSMWLDPDDRVTIW